MSIEQQIRDLRAQGKSWRTIGRHLGKSEKWCRVRVDAEFAERTREQAKEQRERDGKRARRTYDPGRIMHQRESRSQLIDEAAAFATIIPDNRTWQQRAFGDPKPGQSALDQKQGVAR